MSRVGDWLDRVKRAYENIKVPSFASLWQRIIRSSSVYQQDVEAAKQGVAQTFMEVINVRDQASDEIAGVAEAGQERIEAHYEAALAEKAEELEKAGVKVSELEASLSAETEKLVAEREKVAVANKKAVRLGEKVQELEAHPHMSLGAHIMQDSPIGVLHLDTEGKILIANPQACKYLGVDLADIAGLTVPEAVPGESYLGNYASAFAAAAEDLTRHGLTFSHNILRVRGQGFNITAAPVNRGSRRAPVYGGGTITLTPYLPKSTLMELLGRMASRTVMIPGALTIDNVVNEGANPMFERGNPVYVDFKNLRYADASALNIVGKCASSLRDKGIRCVLKNVPHDVAEYLSAYGIEKSIRTVRKAKQPVLSYAKT